MMWGDAWQVGVVFYLKDLEDIMDQTNDVVKCVSAIHRARRGLLSSVCSPSEVCNNRVHRPLGVKPRNQQTLKNNTTNHRPSPIGVRLARFSLPPPPSLLPPPPPPPPPPPLWPSRYKCNHEVIGRVKIHHVLNPHAAATRETYMRCETSALLDDDEEPWVFGGGAYQVSSHRRSRGAAAHAAVPSLLSLSHPALCTPAPRRGTRRTPRRRSTTRRTSSPSGE
jgi:hypothetical protein